MLQYSQDKLSNQSREHFKLYDSIKAVVRLQHIRPSPNQQVQIQRKNASLWQVLPTLLPVLKLSKNVDDTGARPSTIDDTRSLSDNGMKPPPPPSGFDWIDFLAGSIAGTRMSLSRQ